VSRMSHIDALQRHPQGKRTPCPTTGG
jgi:hypothetical protein